MSNHPETSVHDGQTEANAAASSRINVRSMVIRHGSWASIGTALNLFFAFLSTFVLARALSPIDFGRFNVARTGLSFLGILATFGLGTTALGLLGGYTSDAEPSRRRTAMVRIVSIAAITVTIGSIGAFISTMYFGELLTGGDAEFTIALIFALGTMAGGILNIVSDAVRGVGAPGTANMLGNVMQGSPVVHFGTLLVVVVLSIVGVATWQNAIVANSVSAAIGSIVGCYSLCMLLKSSAVNRVVPQTEPSRPDSHAEVPTTMQILGAAWPLALASLISFTSASCDVFMTSKFPDPETMAFYVAARRVIVLLAIPMTVLNTAARGVISPLYSARMITQLEKSLRDGAGLVSIPCVAAALLVMIYPEFVLRVILGEGYSESVTVLRILVPGQVILVISGSCAALLRLSGHQRVMLFIDGLTATALICLGPLCAARFGAVGLATLVSTVQILLNIVTWATALKLTGINTWCSLRVLAKYKTLLKRFRA